MQRTRHSLQPIRDNLGKLWTGVSGAFTDWVAPSLLEGAVLGIFDYFTAEELAMSILEYGEALENGEEPVDMWASDWAEFEEFRLQFRMLARDPRFSRHIGLLEAENVLAWLGARDGRPRLAGVIVNTPNGVEWLGFQMERIRLGLMEPMIEEEPIIEEGDT